jgi:hypothetical protein
MLDKEVFYIYTKHNFYSIIKHVGFSVPSSLLTDSVCVSVWCQVVPGPGSS